MKKMRYHYVSFILVIVMAVSGFTGCASKADNNTAAVDSEAGSPAQGAYTAGTDSSQAQANYSVADGSTEITYGLTDNVETPAYDSTAAEKDSKKLINEEGNGYEAFNTEEYNSIIENDFVSVRNNPLSTFSVDVDTASYSNIRRMLLGYQSVEPDAVRLEEMINYFKYDYKQPEAGVPFSVNTELSDCPWNENAKLLLIGLQAKEIDLSERPSSNIVFLLDVSGSMNDPDKLPLMQKAFIMLTENLTEQDRISIVTYAGQESVILEGARGDQTHKIVSALEELSAGGSTAGSAGIKTAYELAEDYFIKDGNNRVILATDGDLNVGITSEGALTRLIEKERKKGVFLSVLGFGTGNIKDNKMEALADNGNGNYSYIDSILEAKKVLVDEMGGTLFTVAKDVKLQVEFNPAKLKGYRLIGYENRMLNTEDFNDDTKDAGEIGAGHRVTALYELLPLDSKQEIAENDLKYQTEKNITNSKDLLTINIRYKEPDREKSKLITVPVDERIYTEQMPDNLAFASSVASFGMLLRDSKWKGNASYDKILTQLNDLDIDKDDYKDEFMSLVKIMQRNID